MVFKIRPMNLLGNIVYNPQRLFRNGSTLQVEWKWCAPRNEDGDIVLSLMKVRAVHKRTDIM